MLRPLRVIGFFPWFRLFLIRCQASLHYVFHSFQVAFIGLGLGFYYYGQGLENDNIVETATWCNIVAWTFWISAMCYFVCLVVNCRAIRISFAVIATAGDYFAQTKRILFVPMLFFVVGLIAFFIWIFGVMCIYSIGTIVPIMNDHGSYT